MDKDYPLYVMNQSDHEIVTYFNNDNDFVAIYADTLISNFEDRISVEILSGERKSVAGGSASWESVFEVSVPSDTFSLFIFHVDTLSKYSWAEIRDNYKILKRYDLSLGDLQRLDFEVTYPPDTCMEGVRMWPPE